MAKEPSQRFDSIAEILSELIGKTVREGGRYTVVTRFYPS